VVKLCHPNDYFNLIPASVDMQLFMLSSVTTSILAYADFLWYVHSSQ